MEYVNISTQDKWAIEQALKTAARSPFIKFQTGAFAFTDSAPAPLSTESRGWSHKAQFNNRMGSIHAEIHLLARTFSKRGRNFDVYVATKRVKNNTQANARPCYTCAIALQNAGVRRVVHTTNTGLEELYLDNWLNPALFKDYTLLHQRKEV